MSDAQPARVHEDGPPRIIIELTNICNLHCSYCLRDEDALYHTPANFFPVELLRRIISDARDTAGVTDVSFTGGEATLHPKFGEIIETVGAEGMKFGFVTNGWHFERIWPALVRNREAVRVVSFSFDGATREAHDHWRGEGSFVRLIRAVTRCHMGGIPFTLKVGIRRDTVPQLEQIAVLAARLGAMSLNFAHILPTSQAVEDESALSFDERLHAEQEIALLDRIFKMNIGIDVGYFNADPAPPCSALRGTSLSVDYRGRLSLCCNLSGYRGAETADDVVADLTRDDFSEGYRRLLTVAQAQVERREHALAALATSGDEVDLYTGSPCLYCLQSFKKIPWRDGREQVVARSLPVLNVAPATANNQAIAQTKN